MLIIFSSCRKEEKSILIQEISNWEFSFENEWHKADVHSNSDLGKFPWWSIYLTADQAVKVAIDDIYIQSESLPSSVASHSKLATKWAAIK